MKDKRRISRGKLNRYGDKILTKALIMANEGNTAMMKYVLDKYFQDKIRLKGETIEELVKSLIRESSKPGVVKDEIETSIKIIRLRMDVIDQVELEERIAKIEKRQKKQIKDF